MKKRKAGILLILIGVGIPLVLFFFQNSGEIVLKDKELSIVKRTLSLEEIKALEDAYIKKSGILEELLDEGLPKEWIEMGLMDEIQSMRDDVQELMIKEYKDKEWTILTGKEDAISYNYALGLGSVFFLVGIGLFIFSFLPSDKQSKRNNTNKTNE